MPHGRSDSHMVCVLGSLRVMNGDAVDHEFVFGAAVPGIRKPIRVGIRQCRTANGDAVTLAEPQAVDALVHDLTRPRVPLNVSFPPDQCYCIAPALWVQHHAAVPNAERSRPPMSRPPAHSASP